MTSVDVTQRKCGVREDLTISVKARQVNNHCETMVVGIRKAMWLHNRYSYRAAIRYTNCERDMTREFSLNKNNIDRFRPDISRTVLYSHITPLKPGINSVL